MRRKKPFVFFFVLLFFGSAIGNWQVPNMTYFLETLVRLVQPEGKIVYTDQINPKFIYKIKTALSTTEIRGVTNETRGNTISLTRQEKKYLINEIENFKRPFWTDKLFSNSQMIKEEEVLNYIRKAYEEYSENYSNPTNSDTEKMTMVKKYQRPYVFQFSNPIYLRNKTVCLIFFASICGNPCGIDELCFYKYDENKWEKWVVVSENVY